MASLYQTFLGPNFDRLSPALRQVHDGRANGTWHGKANAISGSNPLAHLVRRIIGFPGASDDLDVEVQITATPHEEIWQRRFNGQPFHSRLCWQAAYGADHLAERFGPFTFVMHIPVMDDGSLRMDVVRGSFLGLPLPGFLLPKSDTREFEDADGRFNFDVRVTLPVVGMMVHYSGWLLLSRPPPKKALTFPPNPHQTCADESDP